MHAHDTPTRVLKWGLFFTIIICFLVMAWGSVKTYREAPPIPETVINSSNNQQLFSAKDIINGKAGFQKAALMDFGSIYGMGSLFGEDYTAKYLHQLALELRNNLAQKYYNKSYSALNQFEQAGINQSVKTTFKTLNLNEANLILTPELSAAVNKVKAEINNWLLNHDFNQGWTKAYALNANLASNVADFLIYSSLVTVINRPGDNYSYTNNWPYDPLVGNTPDAQIYTWSWISLVFVFLGFGIVLFIFKHYIQDEEDNYPKTPIFTNYIPLSASQRALWKFFWVVVLVLLLQIVCGAIMGHSYAERESFYGINLIPYLPFSFLRAVHIQAPIIWIGVAWISSALFMANMITGRRELKYQAGLINFLFVVALIIVLGALIGNYLGLMGVIDNAWFFFGNQGLSYLEMGRFWQIGFFIGLLLWSFLVIRNLWPDSFSFMTNFKKFFTGEISLEHLFALSTLNIAILYSFGMIPLTGIEKSFTITDYWRWWVVHLWVEESFEFFTVCASAYFLMGTGLISRLMAERVVFFEAILVFIAGVIGTGHHYYWVGEPSIWVALGSTFSLLEVLPLVLLVIEASSQSKILSSLGKAYDFKLAYLFITGSAFWNFVGAGVFGGGAINIPIINYFEHATFMTLNHAHAALFGAFGLLALGLIYFCLRYAHGNNGTWCDKLGIRAFWWMNIGLVLMMVLNLIPIGYLQFNATVEQGLFFARSLDFYNTTLWWQWFRIVGDVVFAIGALMLALDFMLKTKVFWLKKA